VFERLYDDPPPRLSGELAEIAGRLQFQWPNCDERILLAHADAWEDFRGKCEKVCDTLKTDERIKAAYDNNTGEFIEAFHEHLDRVAVLSAAIEEASDDIRGDLAFAGLTIIALKKTALARLEACHEYVNRYTWNWLIPSGWDSQKKEAEATNSYLELQRTLLATEVEDARNKLRSIPGDFEQATNKLKNAAAQLEAHMPNLSR
jgi:hypothetical protein